MTSTRHLNEKSLLRPDIHFRGVEMKLGNFNNSLNTSDLIRLQVPKLKFAIINWMIFVDQIR